MKYTLEHLAEDISGIWGNNKYELTLGLNKVFVFEEKKSGDIIDGTFSVIKITENEYPTLRLTEFDGKSHDYKINDLSVFETLTISHEGEIIHFKNIPPDEYKGEVFNPLNN